MASLQTQAIKGVKWTGLKTGLVAVIGPVLQVIKARFLIPEEFAYIAIIMIFIGLFNTIENFGISQAIIQRNSIDNEETSSLFFFNIFLALVLGMALYFLSHLIASFFSLPELVYYLKVTSLIVIIGGPSNLFRAFIEKNLLFKELSIIEMVKNIFMLIIVTLLLYLGFGVLGVIYGNLISVLLSTVFITLICLKNKLVKISPYFSFNKLLPFLRFGIFVSCKQVMTFSAHRMDEVLIGYFLPPEILGVYYFGKHMLEKLRRLITQSFSKVLFPVFSKLKHDREKISLAYQRITIYISFVSFPIFTGIAVTAHLFVPVIFGEEWVDSVIVFQVFSIALLLMVLTANVSTSLLYTFDRPDTVFYIDVVTNLIYFVTLYFLASEGVVAVLTVYSLYVIYKTLTLQFFANKQLTHTFLEYFYELKPALLLSMMMIAGVLLFQVSTYNYLNDLLQFIGSVIIGVIIYVILGWVFQKNTVKELRSALLKGTAIKA